MIACTASLQLKILFLIVSVSLYLATRIFSYSCIFLSKCVLEPSDFKVLFRCICSELQNITVKIFSGHYLVLLLFAWLGLKILVSIASTTQVYNSAYTIYHSSNMGLLGLSTSYINCECHNEMSYICSVLDKDKKMK